MLIDVLCYVGVKVVESMSCFIMFRVDLSGQFLNGSMIVFT